MLVARQRLRAQQAGRAPAAPPSPQVALPPLPALGASPGAPPQYPPASPPPAGAPPAFVGVNERRTVSLAPGKGTIILGRHATNDVVIDDPQVSRFHARIDRDGTAAVITDLDSVNGVHVNGQRIPPRVRHPLRDGDDFWIGAHPFRFEGMDVVEFVRPAGVKLDAYHLTRTVGRGAKRVTILNDISLSIPPSEFVAVVGGSGAGKSTLLNALTGFVPADQGRVFYNGIDYYAHFDLFRASLGYVPQDDIIHRQLTVQEVLRYAAQLRLPPDTTAAEREARVEETLRQLQLVERRDTPVSRLSGGQRKRVSIGVELLNQPGIFFLDEPTSGLDPGLEETMMHLFRDLSRQGRTVVVITHATKNIHVCDKVIFLARGGYLAFYGPPKEALEYFGVDDFTGIYRRLETEADPAEWARRFTHAPQFRRHVVEQLSQQTAAQATQPRPAAQVEQPVKRRTPSALRQFRVLTARYLAVLRRDRILLLLFALQPPVVALAMTGIFRRDVFENEPLRAVQLVFITVVASIFLGAMNSAREITKETAIYIRERLVNLKLGPYIASKVLVLSLLSVFQAAIFLLLVSLRVTLPDLGPAMYWQLYLTLMLVNLCGMAMGLMVSALVNNEERATGLVPILILPQMSLAGAIIPLAEMPQVAKAVSTLAISRWGFESMGISTRLNERIDAYVQARPGLTNNFVDAFSGDLRRHYLVLGAFVVVLLTLTTLFVKRKDVR